MLLRNRWALVGADYTTGITALTHYSLPNVMEDPRSLVRDAIFLDKNRDTEAGANLVQRYSGRRPKTSGTVPSRSSSAAIATRSPRRRPSPNATSPGRFVSQQKQLEGLFREVTGNLQRRTEGWDVSKAVRSAVGEVRRNMNNYQSTHSRQSSVDPPKLVVPERTRLDVNPENASIGLQEKIHKLQERNMELAKMLDDALQSLAAIKLTNSETTAAAGESFNICLAKIQFVSVYLSNPDIPIPKAEAAQASNPVGEAQDSSEDQPGTPATTEKPPMIQKEAKPAAQAEQIAVGVPDSDQGRNTHKPLQRPSLADSSFSFMLGEDRHRSSFVSSVSNLPEHSRERDSKPKPKKKVAETKVHQESKTSESEDDGFTLTKIEGGQD